MAKIATERFLTHVAVGVTRARQRRTTSRVLFCALDGPVRVLIEADGEDDARCLCREMAFEFICLCD
jgi:hypothetical protein